MRQYIRYRGWDFVLCVLISIGMAVNVLSGFEIDFVKEQLLILILVTAAVSLLCFLAAVNKRSAVAGIIIGIVLAAAAAAVVRGREIFSNEAENAQMIFYLVIVIAAIAVFLIGRSRVGIVILFLLGNLLHAGAAFLEFPCYLWAYVLFLAGTAGLYFYRVYTISVMRAHTGKVRFGRFMIQNLCMCVAALLLASAVFGGVVRPLDPPTQEIKLIQKLESFEILQKIGVASIKVYPDRQKQSADTPDDEIATDEITDQQETPDSAGGQIETPEKNNQLEQLFDSIANQTDAKAVSYDRMNLWFVWLIAAAAAVAAVILLRRWMRKRWFERIEQLPLPERVYNLYRYFLFGLKKAGHVKSGHLTLPEFQSLQKEELQKYDADGVSFLQLTDIYMRTFYGNKEVTEEEFDAYRTYYAAFRKKLCKNMGRLKYILIYFRV